MPKIRENLAPKNVKNIAIFMPPTVGSNILDLDEGIEHFGPQIRILHQKLPIWSISEVETRTSRSKYEEINFYMSF